MRADLLSRNLFRSFQLSICLPRPALTRACVLMGAVLCAFLLCGPLVGVPAAQAQSGDIIYVDADVGGGPGDSWQTAFSDLNSALDIATGNDVIVIAEGTYTPGSSRSDRFRVTGAQDGLKIYGGWSGTESFTGPADVDAQLESRDLAANETVLSGDIDANDRPFNPTTDSDGISGTPNGSDHIVGENSYTVVYIDGRSSAEGGAGPITRGTVLNGLTMTGALANVSGPQVGGGGIYCQGDGAECSPTLSRLRVVGNRAELGAGILFGSAGGETSPRIVRTAVVGNDAVVGLGASNPYGGGIYFDGFIPRGTPSEPEIFGSLIAYNTASFLGGGISADGYEQLDLEITNTTFEDNQVVSDGRGVGGGRAIFTRHDVTLTNVMVSGSQPIENDDLGGTNILAFDDEGSVTMTHSLVQWGPDDVKSDNGGSVQYLNASGQPVPFDESTNQQGEPGYYRPNSPAGADGAFATDDDGLHLRDTSPAVGAGIGSAPTGPDLTGASWASGAVSLGAYAGSRPVEPVYVDTDAAPEGDGASWGTAFNELEDALAAAQAGDELWIADGVYTPDKVPDFPDSNLGDKAFRITGDQDGIQLYGGFSGSETRRDQRAPTTHRSILSGDVGRDDIDPDGDGIIMDASDQVGTNRSVLVLDGEGSGGPSDQPITSQTVIDGLTITAGKDNQSSSISGGITCQSDRSGGCSAQFRNLVIAGNRSDFGGGGMELRLEGALDAPRITNSVFVGNEASNSDGGGIAILASDVSGARLTNVAFVNNRALNPDGGLFSGRGGAIANFVTRDESRLRTTLTNVTATGNTAEDAGGALYSGGNDSYSDLRATVTVTNGLFYDNQVSSGGPGDEIATKELATTLLTHTLVQGGDAGTSTTNGGTTTYLDFDGDPVDFANSSNQTGDPKFVAPTMPAGSDGTYRTVDDGLHLQPNNVARGTGTVDSLRTITTDLTGASRVQGSSSGGNSDYDAIDLGAYEGGGADLALTFYVDAATGNDANKGTSWSGAFATLQAALDAATSNDQIWVAEGTYLPSEPLDAGDPRTATFEITGALDGLQIYGGFDGTETTRSERDPASNETILSGDIGTTGDTADNAYHVLVFNGGNRIGANSTDNITTDTVLDGLTITGGNAANSFPNNAGGGLYCDGVGSGNACSPSLTGLTFTDNSAGTGGAIYNEGFNNGASSPVITNATFTGNTADFNGGAIYNNGASGTSSPVITNTTFTGNIADLNGGAIGNNGIVGTSSPQIMNTILWGNTATNDGDEIYNDDATPTLAHTLIEGGVNGAGVRGGANTDGGNNLDADPLFVDASDPAGPDNVFGTADDGLRLTGGSPAIARGTYAPFETGGIAEDVTTDLAGDARRFGPVPDLGAYELSTIVSTSDQITGATGLVGYVEPNGFSGLLLLRSGATGGASGDLTFTRTDTRPESPDLPENVAPVTWTVDASLSAAPTYDLVVDVSSLSGIGDFSALMLYKSEDGGQTWDAVTNLGGTLVQDEERALVAVQGLVGFSQFAIASTDANNPLPVELAGFNAQRSSNDAVTVQWQTLSETGNVGFEVQRAAGSANESVETSHWGVSTDQSWQTIATLDGAGTTDEPQSYRFEDTDLPYAADSLRYRLRQIDTDGTESFSEPVTIARQVTQAELLPTYPNPARSQATVRFAVPEQQPVRIHLYDMLGRRVQTVVSADAEGRTEQPLDVSRLASGTYFLRMQTTGHTETQRLTVVR
jgi:hypothetical protein